MTHRHTIGEQLTQFFVTQENSDLTEGRGGMKDVATFTDHKEAFKKAKGRAVQGCGDGDVVRRTWYRCETCPELIKVEERIYHGDTYFKNNMAGEGTYAEYMKDGWRADFSPLSTDPEWPEYLRLRKRFTGK